MVLQTSLMYASIKSPCSILKNFNFCLLLVGNSNEGIKWFQGFIFNKLMHPLKCVTISFLQRAYSASSCAFSCKIASWLCFYTCMCFITNWLGKIAQRLNHIVSGIFIMQCCNTADVGEQGGEERRNEYVSLSKALAQYRFFFPSFQLWQH